MDAVEFYSRIPLRCPVAVYMAYQKSIWGILIQKLKFTINLLKIMKQLVRQKYGNLIGQEP